MPSESRHVARAENNERFYAQFNLASTAFLDWAIAALFYSALHYVDACLAGYAAGGLHPQSHSTRGRILARDAFLRNFFCDYQELKNRSEDARYAIVAFPPAFVAMLHATEFQRIRNSVRSHLSLP